jgi:hypothetical protein
VSRVFFSHSSRDSRQAVAVKAWLIEQEPGLVDEIYLDLDPHTGIRPGERWMEALNRASAPPALCPNPDPATGADPHPGHTRAALRPQRPQRRETPLRGRTRATTSVSPSASSSCEP